MIVYLYVIACDRCGARVPGPPEYTISAARRAATARGWTKVRRKRFCPACRTGAAATDGRQESAGRTSVAVAP